MATPEGWKEPRRTSTSRWRSFLSRGRNKSQEPGPAEEPREPSRPRTASPPPPQQRRGLPPQRQQPPAQSQPNVYGSPARSAAPQAPQAAPAAQRAVAPTPTLTPPRDPRGGGQADPAVLNALRRPMGRSRVIAFINPKGGVHKTTATVLTAAALGSARSAGGAQQSGVIAWDDNELRGTLGLRAGSARHGRTIRHLVEHLDRVEAAGVQLPEHLDEFLRHSADGSFDVLAGDEDPKLQLKLDPTTVLRMLDILTRTHELVCIDTGNNVESHNWRTVVSSADRLVVTTVPREDAAFSADWMLDLLEENGYGHLVKDAVTLLSLPTPNPGPLLQDLSAHFSSRTKDVAVVPYDPALEPGAKIEFSALRDQTRNAWYEAAAKIIDGY
ncbi:MinD/ParA family ATP-binding protein [Salininema proteolyticum]|uniref:MinD/ParA family protein n=1 Tax=Salininema proteolyticum TaxID=1607685 RepID=A0ABV8TXB0_9ACTN